MNNKKKILGICGSASKNSGNLTILKYLAELETSEFEFEIVDNLTEFPLFQTELTDMNVPEKIIDFRNKVANADGIVISTPEYIFSIPSCLKNAIEWCVSTSVFTNKPCGLITASSSGEKAHEELKLIIGTLHTIFTNDTTLLIQGIKNKVDSEKKIIDKKTENELKNFMQSFKRGIDKRIEI